MMSGSITLATTMQLMIFARRASSGTFFLLYKYNMPGRRLIGAGASIYTSGNQGGGDKLQGLPPTTNKRSELIHNIRTRADGGKARHWIFCINQLGGVGHRYGQAAGPAAGRGGVSAACSALARESRLLWMRRPPQGSGYGPPGHRSFGDRPSTYPPIVAEPPIVVVGLDDQSGPRAMQLFLIEQLLHADMQRSRVLGATAADRLDGGVEALEETNPGSGSSKRCSPH